MKIVVGLGNPGKKYQHTRHNIGFEVLAEVARRHAVGAPREKFHAEVLEFTWGDEQVLLVAPQTYMNESGRSVRAACDFYKLPRPDLLVVCDDFHLPTGKLRFRPRGSAAGQKGLQSVIEQFGGDEVSRLRIGVGPLPERWEAADFVLSRFTKDEKPTIEGAVAQAADGVLRWIVDGIDVCMNEFN